MYDENLIDEILTTINKILDKDKIRHVEEHFAGYFGELGITLWFLESATNEEIIFYTSNILNYLNKMLPEGKSEFKWILSVYRSLEQIDVFYSKR